jgi:cell volume regulation protein A
MPASFELFLIITSIMLLLSVIASKISDRFGVPALLVFLLIGMLAGADGPGGIYFDDAALTQYIGILALSIILFSGGLDTDWSAVRGTMKEGLALATVGVVVTAGVVGIVASLALGLSWIQGFLIGAIVSSTDAAAVFSILRSRGIGLQMRVRSLLELESGSNDPMAVFLTIAAIGIINGQANGPLSIAGLLVTQAIFGLLVGFLLARLGLFLINRLRLGYEGMYPVLTLALITLTYSLAALLGGSGFLAVYVAGILLSREDFLHKRSLLRFYDSLAWLAQIVMFLTLGLLVFPSRMVAILQPGLLIAIALMFLARPVSVFLGLSLAKFSIREKAFISWVGLRGAVPIVLATFPFLARLPQADLIFNVVFFVVLLSVLVQGNTIPLAARLTGLVEPTGNARKSPIELTPQDGLSGALRELPLPPQSPALGKAIFELRLPPEFLVILISRGSAYFIPSGGTILQPGDVLLALTEDEAYETAQEILCGK